MYNVLDIANYTINYCIDKDYDITNFKLQKLLYYIQINFLLKSNNTKPCFEADFEAWTFGPVIPEVYNRFRKFGGIQLHKIEDVNIQIKGSDKEMIDDVLSTLGNAIESDLLASTHNSSLWFNAFNSLASKVITKDAIYEYYNKKHN